MPPPLFCRRFLLSPPLSKLKSLFLLSHSHSLCSLPQSSPNPNPNPNTSDFQTWTSHIRGGRFTSNDLTAALNSISDPELGMDLFRWSPRSLLTPDTHTSVLRLLISSRRFSSAESLLQDVLSGSCPPDLPLFNLLIRFSSSRRRLFSSAFDLYKLLLNSRSGARPDLETYSLLLTMLLRRFGKPPVSYIHLHAVRSLVRQMKILGIIPDTYVMNLIVKAYAKCLEMDEAVRVFREMGLYNCEPNEYTYGYLVKGMWEKGRGMEGMRFFEEMRNRGLVPTGGVYMTAVCGLAMERRFEDGRRVMEDMLGNGRRGDLLTYRTFLEGLCREGRGDEAFELLEELRKRKGAMDRRMYGDLLGGLHWLNQPHD